MQRTRVGDKLNGKRKRRNQERLGLLILIARGMLIYFDIEMMGRNGMGR